MTSPVQSLKEQFVQGGWEFVTQLPTRQQAEALHIDFKQKKDAATGELHRDDRDNLSKALSGFANADGGMLVWGVDARQGEDEVDQVQGVVPITQLRRFRSELETLTPDLVSPPVEGVEHLVIPNAPDGETGIVISVIPRSARRTVHALFGLQWRATSGDRRGANDSGAAGSVDPAGPSAPVSGLRPGVLARLPCPADARGFGAGIS